MSTHEGLDVDVVQRGGAALKTQAQHLDGIIHAINGIVANLEHVWHGHNAQTFAGWWQQQHRPALTAASAAISGLGQSALNNASEQAQASSASGSSVQSGGSTSTAGVAGASTTSAGIGGAVVGAIAAGGIVGAASGTGGSLTGSLAGSNRTWQQVQADYTRNSAAYGLGPYGPGGEYQYQCTAWANYRWKELGYTGNPISGNGYQMAANAGGTASTPPSLGAMASYGDGKTHNHVMIVEEMSKTSSGAAKIRVSEMNTGYDYNVGRPEEYMDTRWWDQNPDGTWSREGGGSSGALTFATLKKS
jgi:surface antigen/uncharacterized protein YukE